MARVRPGPAETAGTVIGCGARRDAKPRLIPAKAGIHRGPARAYHRDWTLTSPPKRLRRKAAICYIGDNADTLSADHLRNGAVAQSGERFNGIEEVEGSIPSSSTIAAWVDRIHNSSTAAVAVLAAGLMGRGHGPHPFRGRRRVTAVPCPSPSLVTVIVPP